MRRVRERKRVTISWDSEAHAARICAIALGGTVERNDYGQGQQFDLLANTPTGTAAIEVTRLNDERDVEIRSVIEKLDWSHEDLENDWLVTVKPRIRVKTLRPGLAQLIASLEAHGVDRFSADDDGEIVAALKDLGALYGSVIIAADVGTAGRLVVVPKSSAYGAASRNNIERAINDCTSRPDNLEKLRGASTDEQHLFVWVEASDHLAHGALSESWASSTPPSVTPDLPHGVDAVWLALAYIPAPVWQYHARHGWRFFGTVETRQ
ncbi:MAG: hypothetical protein AAGC53_03650 [Actinomycetota bacterium]